MGKRNLGVESVEYYFENTDTEESVKMLGRTEDMYDYQTASVPVAKMELLHELENKGFRFLETKFKLSRDLTEVILLAVFRTYLEKLNYHEANVSDVEYIFQEMEKGIFRTDKIALDRRFGVKKAGERYVLWAKDEIGKNKASAYIISNIDIPIGFFFFRREKNSCNPFLAGLFHQENDKGLGFSAIYYPIIQGRCEGRKKIDRSII